jgi:hypothetical protein
MAAQLLVGSHFYFINHLKSIKYKAFENKSAISALGFPIAA